MQGAKNDIGLASTRIGLDFHFLASKWHLIVLSTRNSLFQDSDHFFQHGLQDVFLLVLFDVVFRHLHVGCQHSHRQLQHLPIAEAEQQMEDGMLTFTYTQLIMCSGAAQKHCT